MTASKQKFDITVDLLPPKTHNQLCALQIIHEIRTAQEELASVNRATAQAMVDKQAAGEHLVMLSVQVG